MRLIAKSQFSSPLLRSPQLLRPALAAVVSETAFDVERDVKEQMRAPKHGRTYRRGAITKRATKATRALGLRERVLNRGQLSPEGFSLERRRAVVGYIFHRASAPGEAAAVDLGAAVNSIRAKPRGLRAEINGSDILSLLEEGTRRVAARPAFGPAVERARPVFVRKADEAIANLI